MTRTHGGLKNCLCLRHSLSSTSFFRNLVTHHGCFFTFTKESLAFSHVNFKGTIQTTLVRNTSLPVYLVGKYLMEIFGVRFWWRKFWWRFLVEHFEWKILDGKIWWEILVEMPYLTSLNPLHLRFSSESWTPMTTLLVQTSPCGEV